MGGFKLYDENGPVRTLEPQELQSLARKGEIDFPRITEKEIRDRSKGDVLSKGLVVIQTSWFILQCIARRIERLPITKLELVTLAFAALNFVTYALWWNKPLDVQCPVCVLKKQRKGKTEERKEADESSTQSPDDEKSERSGGQGTDTMAVLGMLLAAIGSAIWNAIVIVRKTPDAIGRATGTIVHAIQDAIQRSVKYVRRHRWRTLWIGVEGAAEHGMDPVFSIAAMGAGGAGVGTMFYAGDSGGVSDWSIGIAGAVIATIFGAIHCVAWSFQFPSHAEQLIWRMASLSITCSPMVLVFVALGFRLLEGLDSDTPRWLKNVLGVPSLIGMFGSLVLYVLSRVALLVIALMSLRSLPPGAYETVHWTTFIPHV